MNRKQKKITPEQPEQPVQPEQPEQPVQPEQPEQHEPLERKERVVFPKRRMNSITNFSFKQVLNIDTPVNKTDPTELLKYLVAKAKVSGQFELYKVLNATLAATNHESSFPQLFRKPKHFGFQPRNDPVQVETPIE